MQMGLSEDEIDAIVDLLGLFTDEKFLTNPAYGDPNAAAADAG